jgi:hypothetical protein
MGYFILNNMKICTKCNIEKEFSGFGKAKNGKNGLKSMCKKCVKEYNKKYNIENKEINKQYYIDNKERIIKNQKIYQSNNKEKIKEYNKKYQVNNRNVKNKYQKHRKLNNPLFKLMSNIRTVIYKVIKKQGYTKKSKTNEILGCSYEELKKHLENKFTDGMNWTNYGEWHIDHIYPVSRAIDEDHLIKLNHYTNLQPLWAIDNRIKSNKIK